jgi:phenylalanine-4-hydroxylase
MHATDYVPFAHHAGGAEDLVELDRDHPGFRDSDYRRRRLAIARLALDYRPGDPVPVAAYSDEEHDLWRGIHSLLIPLHRERACREIVDLQSVLPLDPDRIPQLEELNASLTATSGFRMLPVAGLVRARTFMRYLGRQIFLSTQYIRHHSRPLYTPEPDVIHELVGHAATLVHPAIAELSRVLGAAAESATDEEMVRLDRVYWYTLEFGLVEEGGKVKAFGAGLLSSAAELGEFDVHAEIREWDLDEMSRTLFDPTDLQRTLFVAPSFTRLICDLTAWVRCELWRSS